MQIYFHFHYNFKFFLLNSYFKVKIISTFTLSLIIIILLIISVKMRGHMNDKTLGIQNLPKKSGVPLLGFAQSLTKHFSSSSEGFPDHTHNQ